MSALSLALFGAGCASLTLAKKLRQVKRETTAATDTDPSTKPVRAILFDMDGVLADVSRSYRLAIVEAAAEFGVKIAFDDISKAKAAGNANNDWVLTHRLICEAWDTTLREGDAPDFALVKGAFEKHYQGGLWKTEGLIISTDLLQKLHDAGIPMGVITGRPRNPDCIRFLQHYDIAHFFSAVVCMEDAQPKPSPEPVLLGLKQLGVEASPDVIMIGDTVDDIHAANVAGCTGYGVVAPQFWKNKASVANETKILMDAGARDVLTPALTKLLHMCRQSLN